MAETLLDFIRSDLHPVRPILRTAVRTAIVIALAGLAATLFLLQFGFRSDLDSLGGMYFALLSLRIVLGLLLITAALREAVPSRGFPRSISNSLLILSVAALLILPFVLSSRAESISFSLRQLGCYRSELLIAAPAFAVSYWLLARAYPLRPLFAPMAAGLGTGLIADAALFSHCAIDQPAHLMIAHEGGVITVALAGALLGWLLQRKRRF